MGKDIQKNAAAFTGAGCPSDPLLTITLGADNQLKYSPDKYDLVQGCYYQIALQNPSSLEHNFAATEFSKTVFTLALLAGSPATEIAGKAAAPGLQKPGGNLA